MSTEPKTTDKPVHPADKGQTHDTTRDPDRQQEKGNADKGKPFDTTRDPDARRDRDKKEQQPVNDPTGGPRGGAERR